MNSKNVRFLIGETSRALRLWSNPAYYIILLGTVLFWSCKNSVGTNLKEVEPEACNLVISNLQADWYEINSTCNVITGVTSSIDTVSIDTLDKDQIYDSIVVVLDTNFTYTTSPVTNRTKQYLVFDYAGECFDQSTYFVVSQSIGYSPSSGSTEFTIQDFSPLEYYPGSFTKIGSKVRVGICWPIYGFDAYVNFKVQGFYRGKETNVIERSFKREDFM